MNSQLETLLVKYPHLGWIGSAFSFVTGYFTWMINHADTIGKVLGMIAAGFGVVAGYWTARIQRRAFKRGESRPPFGE